ncbi:MAG: acylphosphatase [Phycisphaerae bacterium]|nr:acylphosphatase [Phycisphaerae bacterium]
MRSTMRLLGVLAVVLATAVVCGRLTPAQTLSPRPTVPVANPQPGNPAVAASRPTSRADATSQPASIRRAHFFVSGRVQGVGFRDYTFNAARRQNVTGWVKNRNDGRVEGIAEGPADRVERLLALVKVGPSTSRVDKLEVLDETPTGEFKTFTFIH